MANAVFLLINEISATATLQWYISVAQKASKKTKTVDKVDSVTGEGTIEQFAELYHKSYAALPITLVLSGQYSTYATVPVTLKNQRQFMQALPFLVEEQVIGNIEEMCIATDGQLSKPSIRLFITEKSVLEGVFALCANHNLSINRIFSLPDLLVAGGGCLRIILHHNFALIKDDRNCFQCEQENIDDILAAYEWDDISEVYVSLAESDNDSVVLARKIKSRYATEIIKFRSTFFSGDLFPFLCTSENFDENPPINLVQGDVLSANSSSGYLAKWLPFAWVALLCVFLQVGFNMASGWYFNHRANRAESYASALYLKFFPDEKSVVSLRSQLQVKLESAPEVKTGQFPIIFSATVTALKRVSSASDTHLKQFRFDEESGELKMGLDTASVSVLDKLKKEMSDQGFSVDIISANQENGVIKASLLIKRV